MAADDFTDTVSSGVVANKPARIDTDGVVQRGRRVGVVVDVKLASLKVPPLAGRDLPVNGDCFCPAARVVAGRGAIRAGVAGETPGRVPGVTVGPEQVAGYLASGNEAWQIPVGINEADLTPYVLEAFAGEHVLVSGPARSGKSTMLAAIHQMLVQSPNTKILVGAPRRSPLCQMLPGVMSPEQLVDVVETQSAAPEPCIVMIDDAHLVADESQVLARVLTLPDTPLMFIVAGRNNDLRTLYSHWTGQIRKSRLGVLLVPDADYDGDLLGVRLPRHPAATMSEARGYGCQNGAATLIQGVTVSTEGHR